MADRLWFNSTDPPEPTTSLVKFQIYTADCPALLGGPSAVHSANPPETTTSLDRILDSTADCPLSNSGPSAVQSCEPHQRQHRLWTTSNLTGGLSGPPRRTVRDSYPLTPHNRRQQARRRRRPFTDAGGAQRKGKKAGEHKKLTTNSFPQSVRAEDDRRSGSKVEQASSGLQW